LASARAQALHEHILALPAGQFHGKPLALAEEIEHFANARKLPMIFREEKMQLARGELRRLSPAPRVLIEFGTFIGCSALGWGAILKELNGPQGNSDIKVYSFEVDARLAQIARDLVKISGLEDVVTVIDGSGSDSLKKLVADGKIKPAGVDAVFIDHWEQLYVPDLKLCEELGVFHKGSVIMADNTDVPGAPDYLEYVKGGGSGQPGSVQYESKSLMAERAVTGRPVNDP
jgi:catechol O-methyltransferase